MFQRERHPSNILSYQGPFNLRLIASMGNHLKKILNGNNGPVNRIFKVFVELTQNVANYSAERLKVNEKEEEGVGWFTVFDKNNTYEITTGNVIHKKHGSILVKNCKEINKLNETDLRKLKRYTRMLANVKDVGAHIGLIQTGMIAENPLKYQVTRIDEKYSFFTISVDILKQPIDKLKSN